jgi:hypothetical protein
MVRIDDTIQRVNFQAILNYQRSHAQRAIYLYTLAYDRCIIPEAGKSHTQGLGSKKDESKAHY